MKAKRYMKIMLLSILYLRCTSWWIHRLENSVGLSILYLRCREYGEQYVQWLLNSLSILYLRCGTYWAGAYMAHDVLELSILYISI